MIDSNPSGFQKWFGANSLAYHLFVIAYLQLLPMGAFRLGFVLLSIQLLWHIFSAYMAFNISRGSIDRKFFRISCVNSALGYFYGKRHGFLSAA